MKMKNMNIPERMEHYHVSGLSIALIEKGQISAIENYGVLESGTTKNVTKNPFLVHVQLVSF